MPDSGEPRKPLAQRKQAALRMLATNPSLSDREIGHRANLDHKTVARLRPRPRATGYGRRPVPGEPGALVASAARIQMDDKRALKGLRRLRQEWQEEAWDYFYEVGEINYCADESTEILTEDGWTTHHHLRPGDRVLTLNHETGSSEWQPVDSVHRFPVVDTEMVSIEHRSHSSFTTTNHRWPTVRFPTGVRRWKTSETLNQSDRILTAAPCADQPVEAKYADALVELVAWFWTEGHVARNAGQASRRVAISQSRAANPAYVARIRACLAALYGPPRASLRAGARRAAPAWREKDSGKITVFYLNHEAAAPLLAVAPNRVVAPGFVRHLTAAQLRLFIDTSIDGDGWRHGATPTSYLSQAERARLEGFSMACVLAGLTPRTVRGNGGWVTSVSTRSTVLALPRYVTRRRYSGVVWCPQTANRTWLARRDGTVYYTGNTVNFDANLKSKLRLFAAVRPDPAQAPVPVDSPKSGIDPNVAQLAIATLERLRSPQGGQTAIIRDSAMNFTVAGECWLHGHQDDETGEEEWRIRSVSEVVPTGDGFGLRVSPGATGLEQVDPDDIMIRMWQRDPRYSDLATCPMRAILAEAEALLLLSREIRATAKSRLSNGILLVPSELSFGGPDPTTDLGDGEEEGDPFDAELQESMITPIQEEGSAAAVVPMVIRGPGDYLDKFRHLTLDRTLDPQLDARIEGRIIRIARGLNMPVEVTCADEETEILTARGWVGHDGLRAGEDILTLNHETGLAEWQPVLAVNRFDVADHPMVSLEGRYHSSLTTVDHRWPVLAGRSHARRWRQSGTLRKTDRIVRGAPCADMPPEPKYSDAFVEVAAWFWTEGCYHETGSGYISQSWRANPAKCDRIRAALTALCGPAADSMHNASRQWESCTFAGCGWPVHQGGLCNAHRMQVSYGVELRPVRRSSPPPVMKTPTPAWRESPGAKDSTRFAVNKALVDQLRAVMDDDKVVDRGFLRALTRAQLDMFIDVSVQGDGHRHAAGTIQLHQSVAERTDAFEFACILAGHSVTRSEKVTRDGYSGEDGAQRYMVTAGRATPTTVGSMRRAEVAYTGTVWCPTVRNESWMARRHGKVYFTGNTGLMATTFANATQIKESEFEDHVEPAAVMLCDALTAGYFQPALDEAGVEKEVWRDIFVWYDPEALIVKPDQAEQAESAHRDGIISDEARRRYLGYTEDDKPTDDEMVRRILFHMTRPDPFTMAQLFITTGLVPDLKIAMPQNGIIGYPETQGKPAPAEGEGEEPPKEPPEGEKPAGEGEEKPGGEETPPEKPAPEQKAAALMPGTAITANSVTTVVAWSDVANVTARQWAAMTAKVTPWTVLGARLMGIDRDLRMRILAALDRAMKDALTKAGNRVKSRIQRDKAGAYNRIASATAPEHLASTLGPALVAAVGLSDGDLLGNAFDKVLGDVAAWITGGYRQAIAAIEKIGGPLPPEKRADLDARHAQNVPLAIQTLAAQLQTVASKLLYNPQPGAPQVGEYDPTATVPVSAVRVCLAIAGGDNPAGGAVAPLTGGAFVDAPGPIVSQAGGPAGGVATGADLAGTLGEMGVGTEGYVWVYGDAVRAAFEPHEDLDGVEFVNFDDDVLANNEGWPDTPFYMPGDHEGCMCDVSPILIAPGEGEDSGEPAAEEDVGMQDLADVSPGEVADALGFTRESTEVLPEDIAAARADLGAIRSDLQAAAQQVVDEARAAWDRNEIGLMARPERGESEFEWFYDLTDGEQDRLRESGWVAKTAEETSSAPDEVAERVGNMVGQEDMPFDAAMKVWVDQTRTIDAAKAMSRGASAMSRFNDARYGGLDLNAVLDSPYDLSKVFGAKDVAVQEVAEVNAQWAADEAARVLGDVTSGGAAPWEMTEQQYTAEVERAENAAAHIVPVSDDPDFGPTYSQADEATLTRLGELIPPGLDDPDQPLSYRELYRAILKVARNGGLV